IALADVFVQGADRFGAAVGFVVRLQQAAPPGGVAITHSVRWQLVKGLAAELTRTQMMEMKGYVEPVGAWVWMPGDQARRTQPDLPLVPQPAVAAAPPPVVPVPVEPPPGRPSIAILPFDNMSDDPAADRIADGIVEEITSTLSRVRDFTVI